MSLLEKNQTRIRRKGKFDEDSKVLLVALLFCAAFSSVGFRETLETYHIFILGLVQFLMIIAIGEIRGVSLLRLPSPKLLFYFFLVLFINIAARYFIENALDTSLFVSRWFRTFPAEVPDSEANARALILALRLVHYLIAFGVSFFVACVIDHYCTERKSILDLEREKTDAEFQVVSHLAHNIKPKLSSAQSVLSHLKEFIGRANLGDSALQEQFYEGQAAETVSDAIQKAVGALGQVDEELTNIRALITEEIKSEDFQTVEIEKLFREEITPLVKCHSGVFQIEVEVDPKCKVRLHKHSFVESMINLIRNALIHGFTRPNYRYTVKFVIKKKKGGIIVDYLNDGEPLPSEINQDNLLLYGVKSVESPGGGLGMAYVGKMIKAHHGTFEILDDSNYNVHFRITLPKGGMV